MQTKYGEVKSIYDLFEKEEEVSRYATNAGDAIFVSSKCKICGDILEGQSDKGMCSISMAYGAENLHMLYGQQKRHIELHKTLTNILKD